MKGVINMVCAILSLGVVIGLFAYSIFCLAAVRRENEKYIGERVALGNDTVVVINVHYGYVELSNDTEINVEFLEEFIVK